MSSLRLIPLAALAFLASSLRAQPNVQPGALDFLVGDWEIFDATGKLTATSSITTVVKSNLLSEVRTPVKGETIAMWWVNSEASGNWKQLLLGASGLMRETLPLSKRGEWPLLLGGTYTNPQDGATASFRMSIDRVSDDVSKRKLETSKDGTTWTTIFDQTYRRKTAAKPQG